MGFSGYDSWVESDGAADAMDDMCKAVAKSLSKSLKEPGNSYNTSGAINVALIFEAFINPCADEYDGQEDLYNVAQKTLAGLEEEYNEMKKDDPDEYDNFLEYKEAYRRLIKSMKYFIKKVGLGE